MERSEPTLVPQWLRNTGGVTGAGSAAHHFASSPSHSDVSLVPHTRSRSSKSIGDFESPRSAFLDRSSSSNSRRNSSNGSAKHAYSSFNRSHRDKDRDKDKERYGDPWDREFSDPLGSLFNKVEKDTLRRSRSMVSRKQGEPLARRGSSDLKNSSNSNHNNGNGLVSGGIGSSIQKAVFEKDFPSLGTDERQGVPDIARVPSPGFTTAVQSLPVNSALVGGEGWTSALAEVPSIMGSTNSGSASVQQSAVATSGSTTTPSVLAGLNMAEALQQAPLRTRATPQLSVKTQRLEELAIKQSRQLIPVTPSMPKASALSSEKSKPKTGPRSGEVNMATKSGPQQPPSQNISQYLRSGSVKSETPKTSSHGKFLVLKPVWENGVTPSKDVTSPTHSSVATRAATSGQLAAAPPVVPAPARSPNGQKLSSLERKVSALDLKSGSTLEKRPSLSQVQSRNDFFNLIKKKTSGNPSATLPDSTAPTASSPTCEKANTEEVFSAPTSPHAVSNGSSANGNGEIGEENHREDGFLDEEEAKFLRSLGWEENGAAEDEGLTEEEISAFFKECMENKTLLKRLQPKLLLLSESQATNTGGASSELSSSDSGSDA